MHEPVCAIVVTFHPPKGVWRNLALLQQQVARLIVVDNGSSEDSLGPFRQRIGPADLLLIENGANLGIGAALNIGVRQAVAEGYEWVLLLDQDSVVTTGFVSAMFNGIEEQALRDEVAIFCPRYLDRGSGEEMKPSRSRAGGLLVARTSGSLMPVWAFQKCGWFVEELVIDQIDYEYCLRVRSRGFRIAQCRGATLIHSLGAPIVHRLFGMRMFGTTNHSAARRYYLARNRIWLLKKYWASYPRWCSGLCLLTLKESAKILIVEDRRWSKLWHTLLGLRDGAFGRMGMTVKL